MSLHPPALPEDPSEIFESNKAQGALLLKLVNNQASVIDELARTNRVSERTIKELNDITKVVSKLADRDTEHNENINKFWRETWPKHEERLTRLEVQASESKKPASARSLMPTALVESKANLFRALALVLTAAASAITAHYMTKSPAPQQPAPMQSGAK